MPFNNSPGFNIGAHRDFIRRHGEVVHYWSGLKCTCTSTNQMTGSNLPDANRANPSCIACKGLGYVWIDGGEILGLVTGIEQHKDLVETGVAAPGDLIFSPDPTYTISDWDKVQLTTWTDGLPYEGELITRSASGNTDYTMYGVMDVQQCISVNPTTGAITTYQPGVDFTYNQQAPTNQITWQGTNIPPPGTVYSLKYSALIDWICFAPPQSRRERGTNLGQRVVLRKKHLVFQGV
jgi:hypothetical protein